MERGLCIQAALVRSHPVTKAIRERECGFQPRQETPHSLAQPQEKKTRQVRQQRYCCSDPWLSPAAAALALPHRAATRLSERERGEQNGEVYE